jgi:hypothetical protein
MEILVNIGKAVVNISVNNVIQWTILLKVKIKKIKNRKQTIEFQNHIRLHWKNCYNEDLTRSQELICLAWFRNDAKTIQLL